MQNKKIRRRMASFTRVLKFFCLNKEGTVEDVAAYIKRNYTTAMRIMRSLQNIDTLRLDRFERTNAKGKPKGIYSIWLHGLFFFLTVVAREEAYSMFEDITKVHMDKLLTFRKWEYFKSKNLEKMIRERFFESLRTWTLSTWITFHLLSTERGEPSYPKMHSDEGLAKATDIDVLGFIFVLKPPEDVRRILGEQKWAELMKLFKANEEDYELRMFKKQILFEFETERQEQLKTLNQWREMKAS